jgi:RpiB/LacA/LacB family sugar-phosphate isomerase
MRIAVGADHAGFDVKEQLASFLREQGHQVIDLGTARADVPVDYPDVGVAVGRQVASGLVQLGVCACGTGIGMAMAANKVAGVRAAVIHDVTTATLARQHNHANVVCFGGRTTGSATALGAMAAFLAATPERGRHERRLEKLARLDGRVAAREGAAPGSRSPMAALSTLGGDR